MTRLENRVFDERQTGFIGILHAEFRLRVQIDVGIAKQIAKFGELPLITTGENKFH